MDKFTWAFFKTISAILSITLFILGDVPKAIYLLLWAAIANYEDDKSRWSE